MRVAIAGWPRAGKSTLAERLGQEHGWPVYHADDTIPLGRGPDAEEVARWLDRPGPWVVEGVAVARGLRAYRDRNPGKSPPIDRAILMLEARPEFLPLLKGRLMLGKAHDTVWAQISPWLVGIPTERRS